MKIKVFEVKDEAWVHANDIAEAREIAKDNIDDFNEDEMPIREMDDKELDEKFVYSPEDDMEITDDTPKETFRAATEDMDENTLPGVLCWNMINK